MSNSAFCSQEAHLLNDETPEESLFQASDVRELRDAIVCACTCVKSYIEHHPTKFI